MVVRAKVRKRRFLRQGVRVDRVRYRRTETSDTWVSGGPHAGNEAGGRDFLECWDRDRRRPGGKKILCRERVVGQLWCERRGRSGLSLRTDIGRQSENAERCIKCIRNNKRQSLVTERSLSKVWQPYNLDTSLVPLVGKITTTNNNNQG